MAAVEAATSSPWRARRYRVFQSVFRTETSSVTSSSPATPFLRDASPASPPAFAQYHPGNQNRPAPHHPQLEILWNIVITKLQLPPFDSQRDPDDEHALPLFASPEEHAHWHAALQLLHQSHPIQLDQALASEYDILAWYQHNVRCHFVQHVLPHLANLSQSVLPLGGPRNDVYAGCMAVIRNAVKFLRASTDQYVPRLKAILSVSRPELVAEESERISNTIMARFTRDLHALITNSFDTIIKPLQYVLDLLVEEALQLPNSHMRTRTRVSSESQIIPPETALIGLVEVLDETGIAGERFQTLFAEIMDRKLTQYIHRSYKRAWSPSPRPATSGLNKDAAKSLNGTQASWCIASLYDWIENCFSRIAMLVLSQVKSDRPQPNIVSLADIQQWKEIGIGRLAALRISELFDIVLQWPASKGALDDLKASVTSPQRRWELTTAFTAALQHRLLHPARSTLDILRFYVSMIRTFHALDHSKVLLSRVVSSLQLYLVQREDAVRMVVKGLLASPEEVEHAQKASSSPNDIDAEGGDRGASGKLVELAVLLNDPDQERRMDVDEEDLDWDDMDWVPDPVDAGVNYKRPRSEDVIGTLINTLGSEDVFIKEFQNIISEHLLSTQTNFAQEQKLLDLLKRRFGEAAVQNCEVMVKDIYDSRKVDAHIRRTKLGQPAYSTQTNVTLTAKPVFMEMGKQLDADEETEGRVPYHARILSRLYWPNIVEETFHLPPSVVEVQKQYENGYESLKSARKLTWLQQLGQATVELVLDDRTINVNCKTFEAAVIYIFQKGEEVQGDDGGPVRLSLLDIQDSLQMDGELVQQAVDFWHSQEILIRYSTNPDTYAVLERKDSPPTRPELHPSISAPAAMECEHDIPGMPPKPAGMKRAGTTSAMDAKENERRAIYWQFIVGMLTNSVATMPLSQMAMMLRMVIPDGLPWSDQELQEFLMDKVAFGELEVVGGKYRLVKK
ncbi:unnamed protein product [Discula destructiva]